MQQDPLYRPRLLNADGTVNIVCSQCGKTIIRTLWRGFSTALCHECATGQALPEEVSRDPITLYNPEEDQQKEKVGLASAVFRALGFGKRKPEKEVPVAEESSEGVAKRKRRKPLMTSE